MKRCFVGMPIDDEARSALAVAQAGLVRLPPWAARRLRPVPAGNFHATIKFLGATADAQVAELVAGLQEVARRLEPVEATLAGYDAFPNPARPRAVFATIAAGREHVIAIAESVEEAAVILGFPAEERARVPHVTIARVDQARPRGPLTSWLEQAPRAPLGRLLADRLILFESRRGPESSVYVPLAEIELGAGR